MEIDGVESDYEECAVALDGSVIWRNGIKYIPEPRYVTISGSANTSCQHHRIDNDTWQCAECGERMLSRTVEAETVLSAPNAAPCRDPNHLAAIEAGEDFECSHPYVPDVRRQKTVVIGYDATYRCERCCNDGDAIYDSSGVTWGCGRVHRGQRVSANTSI